MQEMEMLEGGFEATDKELEMMPNDARAACQLAMAFISEMAEAAYEPGAFGDGRLRMWARVTESDGQGRHLVEAVVASSLPAECGNGVRRYHFVLPVWADKATPSSELGKGAGWLHDHGRAMSLDWPVLTRVEPATVDTDRLKESSGWGTPWKTPEWVARRTWEQDNDGNWNNGDGN